MSWYIKSYEFFETVEGEPQSKRSKVAPNSGSPSSPGDGSDSGSDPPRQAQSPPASSPGHSYESSDEDEPRIRSPPEYRNRYDPSGSKSYPYDWPVSEDPQHMRKCYFDHYDLREETNNRFNEIWEILNKLNLGDQPSRSTVPEHTMGGQSFGSSMPASSMFGTSSYCHPEHYPTQPGYFQYPTQPAIMSIPSSSYATPIPFDPHATSGVPLFGTYIPHTEEASLPYELTPIPLNMPYSGLSQVGPSFDPFESFGDASFVGQPDMGTSASYTPAVNPPDMGKRITKPSKFFRLPFTRQPATTPITARPKAKPKGVSSTEDLSWRVIRRRYQLDDLPERELPFYPLAVNKSFWGTMLGLEDDGYYTGEHFNAWMNFLMFFRAPDANWMIVDGEFSRKMSYDTAIKQNIDAVAGRDPDSIPWTSIERVFCPIPIEERHWVLGVLSLADFRMVVYDTMNNAPSLRTAFSDIMETHWRTRLPELMVALGDKGLISASLQFRWEYARNVPQQGGALGDCGPLVCKFIHDMINGGAIEPVGDPVAAATEFRHQMAEMFYSYYS